MKEQFVMPARLRTISYVLIGIGILSLLAGALTLGGVNGTMHFWAAILLDSIFFLLVCVAVTLILAAATLAQGAWQVAMRRVLEAIIMAVPVLGVIVLLVLIILIFGHKPVYPWTNQAAVAADKILRGKRPFLNPGFIIGFSLVIIAGWSFFGWKLRRLSLQEDLAPRGSTSIFWRNIVVCALFVIFYAITNSGSSWAWLMSITPHWYSTLYAWYIFSSTLVCGAAVLTLFVILLKNLGYLEFVTREHLHTLGLWMFAFSIFWTYLWFAQYMLIWYANIPEETTYFHIRMLGAYRAFFYLTLIINFVTPFLALMSRDSKRKYSTMTIMAIIIFLGHWLDFYMIVYPGTVGRSEGTWHLGWYEVGLTAGFVGLLILLVTRNLARAPMYPKNHPFLKETIIHHTY
ncbi:MAG TPA: hypothetical protein VNE41_01990 [Chitinophagaceae bacterium]|nr:hypothetical protein [Chitinophagaceae bacterium]